MGAVRRALAAECRRRWASWLALALLITLVGGTVMAGVTAAQRTNSAIPDFVHQYGADVAVFGTTASVGRLTQLPGATARVTASLPAYVTGNFRAGSAFVPSSDLTVWGTQGYGVSHAIKLLSGRWPTRVDDVLVGFSLAQLTGLHIGSVLHVPLYAASQAEIVYNSSGTPTPHGPDVALNVVGISASITDFPTTPPSYSLVVGTAFGAHYGRSILVSDLALYRLVDGARAIPRFEYDVNHLNPSSTSFSAGTTYYFPFAFDGYVSGIENSITPQVTGWWLFALLSALAGLALIGQALARQSLVEREAFPTLSALGYTPNQLFWIGLLRGTFVGTAGALGAAVLEVLVSPLTPVGEARAAETTSGIYFDAPVVLLGVVVVVAVAGLLSVAPSWRAAQVRQRTAARDRVSRPSMLAGAASRAGAPPTVLIGMRHALEAGRGRGRVPVTTALFGMIAAVGALSATSVFGASLTTLLGTPHLYGQNWNIDLSNLDGPHANAIAASVSRMPGVEQVTFGVGNKTVNVNGAQTNLLLLSSAKGRLLVAGSSGFIPTQTGQIALGEQTLVAAHATVGSDVTMAVIGPSGKQVTRPVKVTGVAVFPPVLGFPELGDGAVATFEEAFAFLCGTTSRGSPCVQQIAGRLNQPGFANWGVVIKTADSPLGVATQRRLENLYGKDVIVITAPTDLVNFGSSVNFPVLLGAMAGVFGAAALIHLLLVSVSRRRRELALLKVLGFARRQAAATVCGQSATISLIGLVVGIPIGIAVGRVAWLAFVHNLGAVPQSVVPVEGLLVVSVGALACAVAFASVPATLAARLRPAEALREG